MSQAVKKNLGELLVKENVIDLGQLELARREQKKTGGRLSHALVKLGLVNEMQLTEMLGQEFGVPAIDLSQFEIDKSVISLVSRQVCEKHKVIPISQAERSLVVAFADPSNIFVKDDLSLLTRRKIEVVVASETAIKEAIDKYYPTASSQKANLQSIIGEFAESDEVADMVAGGNERGPEVIDAVSDVDAGPIIKFVNAMLAEAIKLKASDIHIEPYEARFRIRFRVDGTLIEKTQPPAGTSSAIVSRIKILCKMDIAERRKPQDGRLKVKLASGKDVDFRVSAVPTLFGEKVVLRLLDKSNLQVDMAQLGLEPRELEMLMSAIYLPQGMVLITGPTGSGKTTTIYSALAELNKSDRNITTAEDPVEFNLDGINQVQINADVGLSFPSALKAFLRQDPEIIMVGEIRDYETASIAYKAASTGHLVVSTLHTNDAAATVTRLIDMGVAPFMVAEATSLIVAQRLIKRNCGNCSVPIKIPDEVLLNIGVLPDELSEYTNTMKGEGCPVCNGSGLKGRIAIFEVMKITSAVKDAVFAGKSPLEIKRHAVQHDKMVTLRRNALLKLKSGQTTVEQVINTSVEDDL